MKLPTCHLILPKFYIAVTPAPSSAASLALDGSVDVAHKEQRCAPADGAEHDEEGKADTGHVAEEEAGLHPAAHVAARQVVVEAVPVDEQPCTPTERPVRKCSLYVRTFMGPRVTLVHLIIPRPKCGI